MGNNEYNDVKSASKSSCLERDQCRLIGSFWNSHITLLILKGN